MNPPILSVRDLMVRHGKRAAVEGVGFEVAEGEVLLVLGHNGAGKTTLLTSIFGLHAPSAGSIQYRGQEIAGRNPAQNVSDGIAYVPQGHGVFRRLSVRDNLMLGALTAGDRGKVRDRLAGVHDLFPILEERSAQIAGTMSGGQQQMLAVGIALMQAPSLLILDEPSIGLAPKLVEIVMGAVTRINREMGTSVILVEQNIEASLPVAARSIVLKTGRKAYDGASRALADRPFLMTFF